MDSRQKLVRSVAAKRQPTSTRSSLGTPRPPKGDKGLRPVYSPEEDSLSRQRIAKLRRRGYTYAGGWWVPPDRKPLNPPPKWA